MAASVQTNVSVRLTERTRMHLGLFVVQLGYGGYAILTRVALTSGLSRFIFPLYRNGIALLLLAPAGYFLERSRRPALTLRLLAQFFLLGLLGVFGNQMLYLAGLQFTSATVATLMQNLVPVFAFVLAAASGLEEVRWRRKDGLAKVLGTLVCVAGAVTVTLYKGPTLLFTGHGRPPLNPQAPVPPLLRLGLQLGLDSWYVGILCLIGNCLCWAGYLNLQAPVVRDFPAPVSMSAFLCLFGTAQSAVLALFLVREPAAWLLTWGPEVIGVLYAGLVASALNFAIQTWCVQKGGPFLVAVYEPLQCVVTAFLALVFLGDTLYLGSCLGGILIILGLYSVTWGQVENERLARLDDHADSSIKQSLLQQPQGDSP